MYETHVTFADLPDLRTSELKASSSDDKNDADTVSTTSSMMSRELKPLRGGLLGRRLSWMTVDTKTLPECLYLIAEEDPYVAEKFKLLLVPPHFDRDDLLCSSHNFMFSLTEFIPSVKLDTTFQVFQSIRSLVKSSACARLFGLLIHYEYWNVIRPIVKAAIAEVKQRVEQAERQREEARMLEEQREQARLRHENALLSFSRAAPYVPMNNKSSTNKNDIDSFQDDSHDGSLLFADVDFAESAEIQSRVQMPQAILDIDEREGKTKTETHQISSFVSFINDRDDSSISWKRDAEGQSQENIDAMVYDDASLVNEQMNIGLLRASSQRSVHSQASSSSKLGSSVRGKLFRDVDRLFDEEVADLPEAPPSSASSLASSTMHIDELFVDNGSFNDNLSLRSSTTEASLSASEKEQLFVQLEMCIVGLFEKMGRNKFAVVTGRQALISCAHFVVDEILAMIYPWFAVIPEGHRHRKGEEGSSQQTEDTQYTKLYTALRSVNLRLRRYVHQSISDLIDPTRSYTSVLLLSAVLGVGEIKTLGQVGKKAQALQRGDRKVSGRGKYYRTSAAIFAIFGDSNSYQTRKFLQRTGALYSSIPGAVTPYDAKLERLHPFEHDRSPSPPVLSHFATATRTESRREQLTSSGATANRPLSRTSASSSSSPSRKKKDVDAASAPRFDFHKIFVDQPDVDYFPTAVFSENAHLASQQQHKVLLESKDSEEARLKQINEMIHNAMSVDRQREKKTSRREYLNKYAPSFHKTLYPPTSLVLPANDTLLRQVSRGALGFSKLPTGDSLGDANDLHRRKQQQQKSNSKGLPTPSPLNRTQKKNNTSSSPLFSKGNITTSFEENSQTGSLSGSSSLGSMTLVHNNAADIPISLHAKTALMNLMVEKTSYNYLNEIPTDVTAARLAMIKGSSERNIDLKKNRSSKL